MKDKGLFIYNQQSKSIYKLMLTSDKVWMKYSPTKEKKKNRKEKPKARRGWGVGDDVRSS